MTLLATCWHFEKPFSLFITLSSPVPEALASVGQLLALVRSCPVIPAGLNQREHLNFQNLGVFLLRLPFSESLCKRKPPSVLLPDASGRPSRRNWFDRARHSGNNFLSSNMSLAPQAQKSIKAPLSFLRIGPSQSLFRCWGIVLLRSRSPVRRRRISRWRFCRCLALLLGSRAVPCVSAAGGSSGRV